MTARFLAWLVAGNAPDLDGLALGVEQLAADGLIPGLRCDGRWLFDLDRAADALDALAEANAEGGAA